jgi:hypothetical protein
MVMAARQRDVLRYQGVGRVAEWFKAPVLKTPFTCMAWSGLMAFCSVILGFCRRLLGSFPSSIGLY